MYPEVRVAKIEGGVKLKWGTLTKIAKRRKVSMTHIRLVAKGEREGSAGVVAINSNTPETERDTAIRPVLCHRRKSEGRYCPRADNGEG
jgi:hypothetical protein